MPTLDELRDRLEALADHPSPRTDDDLLLAARHEIDGPRRSAPRHLAVAAAVLVLGATLGAVAWVAAGRDRDRADVSTTAPTTSPSTPGDVGTPRWDPLPGAPGPLSRHVVLVPGGAFAWTADTDGTELTDGFLSLAGAAYDEAAGSWTTVARPQQLRAVPRQHGEAATIWTGEEVLLVVPTSSQQAGAAGELTTVRWRPGDAAARLAGLAVIPGASQKPEPNLQVHLTMDGDDALALVTRYGVAPDPEPSYQATHQLWRYDLDDASWTRLEDPPATGDRIYGFEATPAGVLLTSSTPPPEGASLNRYGPILVDRRAPDGTWSRSTPGPEPLSGQSAGASWDGRRLVVVSYTPSAAAYDPVTDAWTTLAVPPIDGCEDYPSVVRTGSQVITGYCGRFASLRDGDEAWTALPTAADHLSWLRDADASTVLGIRWPTTDARAPELVVLRWD